MMTRCAICLELSLKDREIIDKRLARGDSYPSIMDSYPDLERHTLKRHKKHSLDINISVDVAIQRERREMAEAKLADWNHAEFTLEIRERLMSLVDESLDLIEATYMDVMDGLKPTSDFNEAIAAHIKLVSSLSTFTGLKNTLDANAAIAKVTKMGYLIMEKEV